MNNADASIAWWRKWDPRRHALGTYMLRHARAGSIPKVVSAFSIFHSSHHAVACRLSILPLCSPTPFEARRRKTKQKRQGLLERKQIANNRLWLTRSHSGLRSRVSLLERHSHFLARLIPWFDDRCLILRKSVFLDYRELSITEIQPSSNDRLWACRA